MSAPVTHEDRAKAESVMHEVYRSPLTGDPAVRDAIAQLIADERERVTNELARRIRQRADNYEASGSTETTWRDVADAMRLVASMVKAYR
jgi:hypothetical protein